MMRSCGLQILIAVWLLLIPAAASGGGTIVQFTDGRALEVEGVALDGRSAVLTLDGGSRMSLPLGRIARWYDAAAATAGLDASAPEAWRLEAGEFAELIEAAATRYELDPALLTAMARVESAFDPLAVSNKGACGLLQLMPATAERFGVEDVFDAGQNVDGGARYLRWLLEHFEGQTDLALAGYNAGEGAVERHRGIPPYRETRTYVTRVLQGAGRLAALAP
jgi:soluble lytic murein transglycosylase-like protein